MPETPQELLDKLPDSMIDEANAVAESMGVEDTAPEEGPEGFANTLSHRCLGEGVTDQELQHAPEWDRPLLEMYRGVTDPESDPNRALTGGRRRAQRR